MSVKCCCLSPLMATVIEDFVMSKFAMWLKLTLLFRSSTSHIETFEKQVTCILPFHPPPYPLLQFMSCLQQMSRTCDLFICAISTPKVHHILNFLSHHLSVSLHPTPLQSAVTQGAVPCLFLIEAAAVCFPLLQSHRLCYRVLLSQCILYSSVSFL